MPRRGLEVQWTGPANLIPTRRQTKGLPLKRHGFRCATPPTLPLRVCEHGYSTQGSILPHPTLAQCYIHPMLSIALRYCQINAPRRCRTKGLAFCHKHELELELAKGSIAFARNPIYPRRRRRPRSSFVLRQQNSPESSILLFFSRALPSPAVKPFFSTKRKTRRKQHVRFLRKCQTSASWTAANSRCRAHDLLREGAQPNSRASRRGEEVRGERSNIERRETQAHRTTARPATHSKH